MTVQLSDKLCEDKFARSDSGSAAVVEDNSETHKKVKLSEKFCPSREQKQLS